MNNQGKQGWGQSNKDLGQASIYNILKAQTPEFTKKLDHLILDSEENGNAAVIVTKDQTEYKVIINPVTSIVYGQVPEYLKRRIKKVK